MQKVLVHTVAALCLLPGAVWAQTQAPSDAERYYGWGPHMMGWGGGWYAMIFGPLFMILFLGILIAPRGCPSALAGRPMARDISAPPIAAHPDAT